MLAMMHRRFSTAKKVCILANSATASRKGAELVKDLRNFYQQPLEFIGAGGEELLEAGVQGSLYDTSHFPNKPFTPFRSIIFQETNPLLWGRLNPITKNYVRPMNKVLKEFNQNELAKLILYHRPNLIITMDHDILSWKIQRQIADVYATTNLRKPKQLHFGRFVNRYVPGQMKYLDHVFYTMPIEPNNWTQFKISSTYVGHEAFDRAYRFLLSRNGGKHLYTQDSVFMHLEHFYSETEIFIERERTTFRNAFGIDNNDTVLFMSPGNKEEEIEWSLKKFHETANIFAERYIQSTNTVVVIPSTPNHLGKIKKFVNSKNWRCRVIITETEADKSSALAGSDLGICYNGEIVTECLVNQLTTVVIQNMNKLEFYFTLSWNRFANDMNILADGDLFQEIMEGQCHGEKLVEVIGKWHESPPHRFWPLQQMEIYLSKILPIKARQMGMGTHQEYWSPRVLTANTLTSMLEADVESKKATDENLFYQSLNKVQDRYGQIGVLGVGGNNIKSSNCSLYEKILR